MWKQWQKWLDYATQVENGEIDENDTNDMKIRLNKAHQCLVDQETFIEVK